MKEAADERRKCDYPLAEFDYELPRDLIAQAPSEKRDACRLLVCDRSTGSLQDLSFRDLPRFLSKGDALVLNDTRVFPARLLGKKTTGGKADVLLIAPAEGTKWKVLLRPPLKEGQEVVFGDGEARAVCRGRDREGMAILEFDTPDVRALAKKHGKVPLPPYIGREPDGKDAETYQTVYAEKEGAVAAPTAGLHFTRELLRDIEAKGISLVRVTLQVGYGTFKPVQDILTHRMHSESFELTSASAEAVNQAAAGGGKIWAVGTTAVRVLETCVLKKRVIPGTGETDLFLYPPADFEIVGGLVTNFHLPRSTLLMLVSAFMGHAFMKKAYRHAVKEKYRFYSYGDAMLIL